MDVSKVSQISTNLTDFLKSLCRSVNESWQRIHLLEKELHLLKEDRDQWREKAMTWKRGVEERVGVLEQIEAKEWKKIGGDEEGCYDVVDEDERMSNAVTQPPAEVDVKNTGSNEFESNCRDHDRRIMSGGKREGGLKMEVHTGKKDLNVGYTLKSVGPLSASVAKNGKGKTSLFGMDREQNEQNKQNEERTEKRNSMQVDVVAGMKREGESVDIMHNPVAGKGESKRERARSRLKNRRAYSRELRALNACKTKSEKNEKRSDDTDNSKREKKDSAVQKILRRKRRRVQPYSEIYTQPPHDDEDDLLSFLPEETRWLHERGGCIDNGIKDCQVKDEGVIGNGDGSRKCSRSGKDRKFEDDISGKEEMEILGYHWRRGVQESKQQAKSVEFDCKYPLRRGISRPVHPGKHTAAALANSRTDVEPTERINSSTRNTSQEVVACHESSHIFSVPPVWKSQQNHWETPLSQIEHQRKRREALRKKIDGKKNSCAADKDSRIERTPVSITDANFDEGGDSAQKTELKCPGGHVLRSREGPDRKRRKVSDELGRKRMRDCLDCQKFLWHMAEEDESKYQSLLNKYCKHDHVNRITMPGEWFDLSFPETETQSPALSQINN